MSAAAQFGVAGWSYADWRGRVYASGCRDALGFVLDHVDFIEINTTFYRVPRVDIVDGWGRRASQRSAFFTAKIPGEITHARNASTALAAEFRASMEPLRSRGVLRCLLAQFSHELEAGPDAYGLLQWIRDEFADTAPLVLEVRHRSWRAEDAQSVARSIGFALADLDYPGNRSGFMEPSQSATQRYFRLHGRNAANWYAGDAGRDAVYDWHYGHGEVEEIARRVERAVQDAAEVLVVANNHFEGKAMKVALELMSRRRGPVDVPPLLLEIYPELARVARRVQRGLFDVD